MTEEYEFKRTHHGKLFGIPVYLDMREEDNPGVEPKYYLGWALSIAEFFFAIHCFFSTFFDPLYEPMFPFLVGEEVTEEQ